MAGSAAARETGSLLQAEMSNSGDLLHWYIISVLLVSSFNCDTGASASSRKIQCALSCEKFGFHHISLDDVLREKSEEQTYPHAGFLKACLKEQVNVPRDLKVSLLERKIDERLRECKKWCLVDGFPDCIQELLEFEEKVSHTRAEGPFLHLVGAKDKLHSTSHLLDREGVAASRQAGS